MSAIRLTEARAIDPEVRQLFGRGRSGAITICFMLVQRIERMEEPSCVRSLPARN
jgi:hypothetical protein